MQEENAILDVRYSIFNKKYLPLLSCDSRYLVLYGGAGSGKSVFIVQRYLLRLMSSKGRNLLVVRAVSNTNRDSTFAAFKQVIGQWGISQFFKINESDMRIRLANGSCIIFKGLDDTEKLKSITFENGILTDVWVEEASEVARADFNQLDIRLRGSGPSKQMVISFNPTDINHWLKKRFIDKKSKDITVLHSTYLDNDFLEPAYKQLLEGYRETDPYYYSVYCLGQWGVYGSSVFNASRISQRIAELKKPLRTGMFTYTKTRRGLEDIKWKEDEYGYIFIYEDPDENLPYVIGADTAGDGSDSFAAQVLSNTDGKQVAMLRHSFDEDLFACQLYCLGKMYNNALIGIESNYSTYPIKELTRLGYENQYIREQEDMFTHKPVASYGFKTTSVTRPVIISGLIEAARDGIGLINDKTTLEEMLTFVRNKHGRPEAQYGAHDDCVMALAIANYIRPQAPNCRRVSACSMKNWTEDMIEDYENGSETDRIEMERVWSSVTR